MSKQPALVKARCVEIDCPHWGWVKVKFDNLDFDWWQDDYDSDLTITINCICGESHEIQNW
jgi:hypothetical protein